MKRKILVKEIGFPEIEKPVDEFIFDFNDYQKRYDQVKELMLLQELDYLIVYGDQRLYSNIYHLTGVDLKFEQALLIIGLDKGPAFITGIEMLPLLEFSPYKKKIKGFLYEPFSLQGMPHGRSFDLGGLIRGTGINKNHKIGIVGDKYYPYLPHPEQIFDIPGYIINTLAEVGSLDNLTNATGIMTDNIYGIRNNLFPRDIASIEYSQRMLCYGMKNMIENFRIGMNAVEAASHFYYSKEMPFSVPFGMVFGGEEIDNMGPPRYSSILHEGDFILIGSAIRNSSMARSGIAVGNARQLNKFKGGIMEEFYFPYYENIANWYESVRTGKRGGDIYNAVGDFVEDPVFGVELNPGHLTHLYEWVDSPFYKGSPGVLHPGMVIQCELISRHKKFNSYLLLEEGLVLADAGMRKELENGYPAVFQRIKKRRKYMSEVLGIILDESVLPLSDTQAILNPFLLDINTVLVLEK